MRITMLVGTLWLALFATQASAQTVTYDYAAGTDFTHFATYAWVPGTPVPDEMNHDRVVAAVEEQLMKKGLRAAAQGEQPDVLVAYHANFDRDVQITANSTDWGPRFYGANRNGTARVEELLRGNVLLELFGTEAQTVVWRGTASREIDVDANPEKRTKNIRKAMEKLFRNYPPKQ